MVESNGKWHIEYRGSPLYESDGETLKTFEIKDDAWNFFKSHKKEVTRK